MISEDDPSNLDYRFYKLFHPYVVSKRPCEGNFADIINSPTNSHPGRAVSINNGDDVKTVEKDELPSVHSSPSKK